MMYMLTVSDTPYIMIYLKIRYDFLNHMDVVIATFNHKEIL